jgi:hypothetical protein
MSATSLTSSLTQRDELVLRDMIRFGALTLEQIARRYLDDAPRLESLVEAGYAEEGPKCIQGTRIFAATGRAKRAVNSELAIKPVGVNSALCHNLTLVNLADWLVAPTQFPNAIYRTDRELQAGIGRANGEPGGDAGHWPDGLLINGRHHQGIELELKWGGDRKYHKVCRWFAWHREYDAVHWYTASPRVLRRVPRIAEDNGLERDIEILVDPLPVGVEVLQWARGKSLQS